MIDLYTSRRDKFLECEYWSQEDNQDLVDLEEIVHKEIPTGKFYAKEINPYTIDSQVVVETFMVESASVVIQTEDNVSNLRRNDIVKFDDFTYRVENIQRDPMKKQRQYMRTNKSSTYYISLRG